MIEAIERFLALEAKGWKGARATALAADSRRGAFAREMLVNFSRAGQLRIHELTLDGAAIAAGVELRAARRSFFWKIAYDETYAAYSPGVLLTRALTTRLAEEGAVDLVELLRPAGSSDDRAAVGRSARLCRPGGGASRWPVLCGVAGGGARSPKIARTHQEHRTVPARTQKVIGVRI